MCLAISFYIVWGISLLTSKVNRGDRTHASFHPVTWHIHCQPSLFSLTQQLRTRVWSSLLVLAALSGRALVWMITAEHLYSENWPVPEFLTLGFGAWIETENVDYFLHLCHLFHHHLLLSISENCILNIQRSIRQYGLKALTVWWGDRQ